MERTYIAIDLKSFYASVECRERGLDPLTANLVVADASRTEKTICLAVSPSLKAYGIPGRARLFEVVEKVKEVNSFRKERNHGKPLPANPIRHRSLQLTLPWNWIISWRRPEWRYICVTVRKSIRFI